VESELGKGTTFHFTIRVEIATDQEVKTFYANRPAIETAAVVIDYPLRVLVAEDNKVNPHIVSSMLKKLGYIPDIVENGQEAIDAVLDKPYNLIYMDVQMPICDGLQAMRKIRSMVSAEDQPLIVALTANAFEEQKKECFEAGADSFVAKPFSFSDIQNSIIDSISQLKNKEPVA
jgi:CheY-like chemotaxis protein